jgi:hypothetical protein
MPYFSDKKILFIHIPKNGGMYVEKCLGIPDELVGRGTPTKTYWTTRVRTKLNEVLAALPHRKRDASLGRRYLYGYYGGGFPFQHASLEEIVQLRLVPRETLEQCTVLAVHRHPLDRAISVYKYWGLSERMSFRDYCARWLQAPEREDLTVTQLCHIRTQCSYIDTTSELASDVVVLPFEDLSRELGAFLDGRGMENRTREVERVNVSRPQEIEPDPESVGIVEDVYSCDYDRFGYEYSKRAG